MSLDQAKHSHHSLYTLGLVSRFLRKCKASIMSKRAQRASRGRLDLDDELRRRSPPPAGLAVKKDNWKVSSDRARADPAWNKTKRYLGIDIPGFWEYSNDGSERYWISSDGHATPKGSELSSLESRHGPFPAYEGDREISKIYRELWLEGDLIGFIDTIYKHYAVDDVVPEVDVWRIWRCLVGELIPVEHAWNDAPSAIIADPDTIWQTGKCIFQILTKGRFFNNELNLLQLVDNGEKFGAFKVSTLHVTYSQNLLKLVLSSFAYISAIRPTRELLLNHIEEVLAIYAYGPTKSSSHHQHQPYEERPYRPHDALIPKGLNKQAGAVYETILDVVEERKRNNIDPPKIVVITDLAKDFDDLLAMIALKELHRVGAIHLEGFVANLYPADRRARLGRGALDDLRLFDIPIAEGTAGEVSANHRVLDYEFEGSETFIAPEGTSLPDGQDLLRDVFTRARDGNYKVTLLCLSSLLDIADFAETDPELLKTALGRVVLQGGYNIIKGKLEADQSAANNNFSFEAAKAFHKFMQENEIPSTCFTKVATFATPIYQTFLEQLSQTKVKVGVYLRAVQLGQDLYYWKCASGPPSGRFRSFMDEPWFLSVKTTWYDKHEFDEPGPEGDAITPWLDKVTAYDCLAAIGAAGEDILDVLGVTKPIVMRTDAIHPTHKVVGVLAVDHPEDKTKNKPEEANVHGELFAVAIKALVLGSLLSVQQGL